MLGDVGQSKNSRVVGVRCSDLAELIKLLRCLGRIKG